MVDPGDTVSNTLKKEFGEEALNSMEMSASEGRRLQAKLENLFKHGTEVHYVIEFKPNLIPRLKFTLKVWCTA